MNVSSSKDACLLTTKERVDVTDAEVGRYQEHNSRGQSVRDIVHASSRTLVDFVAASFRRSENTISIESFQLIEHKEAPELPWHKKNPDLIADYLVSTLIFALGYAFIFTSQNGVDDLPTFVAEILFASGLIPLVEAIVEVMRRQRDFEVKDMTSLAFVAVATSVYVMNDIDSLIDVAGETLFATGFIYWIHRALAFAPHPNDAMRSLEKENSDLKQSVALGLADGYYWNFLEPIARQIAYVDGHGVSLEFESHDDRLTIVPYFLVIVPKTLFHDSVGESQSLIPGLLHKCRADDRYSNCHLTEQNESRHKQFCHVAVPNNNDTIFDIPSTLDTIIKQMKQIERTKIDRSLIKSEVMKKRKCNRCCVKKDVEETLEERYQKEIRFFSSRLAYHLSTSELEDYVRVVEVDIQNPDELHGLINEISGRYGITDLFSSARTKRTCT